MNRNEPYNALSFLPSAIDLAAPVILKKVMLAKQRLVELKDLINSIPNQSILVNGIILQEARFSLEIENIITTNNELYTAAADEKLATDPHAKAILRYRQALWHGYRALKNNSLSTHLFMELVEIIKASSLGGGRTTSGAKISNSQDDVIYISPERESISHDQLAKLEKFIHAEDNMDPLIKLAIMHYHFAALHSFVDGDGGASRIVDILFLVEKGLLKKPALLLSHYRLRTKIAYYEGLRGVTEKADWLSWILYILDAIEVTAAETQARILKILAAMAEAKEIVQAKTPNIYSNELIEVIFQHPYCKLRFVEEAGLGKRQTVAVYLKTLETLGLLQSVKNGHEQYFINKKLVEILSK